MNRSAPSGDGRLFVGIDEAGYGPLVGPLCVGMCVLRVPESAGAHPDVWSMLAPVVTRRPEKGSSKLAVNDSKTLKGANSLKRTHPLAAIEKSVLAFAGTALPPAGTDAAFLDAVGARALRGDAPWYGVRDTPLPLSTTGDHISLLRARLSGALAEAGVELADMRCIALPEPAYNERIARTGSKARVNASLVASMLSRVRGSSFARTCADDRITVVIDRLGGRLRYESMLGDLLPGAAIRTVEESRDGSVYAAEAERPDGAGGRMTIVFRTEADTSCFPVALASMVAKYVRELAMARFNRYWSGLAPELKPTAGYGADARRWLDDLARLVSRESATHVRRRA